MKGFQRTTLGFGTGPLTPRPSRYAGRGWRGALNWVRDNIISELAPVCDDDSDALAGDEQKTVFDTSVPGLTQILGAQVYNIDVREIFVFVTVSNTIRFFSDAVPIGPAFTLPDTSAQNVPPFTLTAGKSLFLNLTNATRVEGWVRWRYLVDPRKGWA